MNFGKRSVTFLAIFLIVGLKNHFTDGLIELAETDQEKMIFEMEFFNVFDKIYNFCRQKFLQDASNYDLKYWNPIENNLKEINEKMLQITNKLKIETSCIRRTYKNMKVNAIADSLAILWVVQVIALDSSSDFFEGYFFYKEKGDLSTARLFADIAVYTGSFGAYPIISTLLFDELDIYLNTFEVIRYRNNVGTFPLSAVVDTKCEELKNREVVFQKLRTCSTNLKSLLYSIIFAKSAQLPGSKTIPPYKNKDFWGLALKSEKLKSIISTVFQQTSSGQDGWSDPSTLINLLREIEKLKIRINNKMENDEIEKIARGFDGQGTLVAQLVATNEILYYKVPHYLLFSKLINRENDENFLADKMKVSDFKNKFLIEIESLKKSEFHDTDDL